MQTVKNGFQILNLHPKNIGLKKKTFLGMNICQNFTKYFINTLISVFFEAESVFSLGPSF